MVSDPNLIFFVCIAKGPVILAQFSSKEEGIQSLAQKCIEKTPPFHSMFSHTVAKKTYTFLIDEPFAYFIIFHEDLEKSESFWVLNRLKSAFEDFLATGLIVGTDNLTPDCLQSFFNPIFSEIMALDSKFATSPSKENRPQSLDSSHKGKKTTLAPLLGNPIKGLKKKKRALEVNGAEANKEATRGNGMENKVDVGDDFRDFPVSMHKNGGGLYMGGDGGDKQKAKQIWRKHVWVVLMLDLMVCATLFAIWLWVCRGFQCIDG